MIFKYNSILNIKKIQNLITIKKLAILDFGCGTGVWTEKNLENKKIKKVILYDVNKKLIKILKKKYKQEKVDIVTKSNYNLVIISSVIQYISLTKFKNLIEIISKKKKKKNFFIVIADIPIFPRPVEFVLMPLFNLKRFFFFLKIIFASEYKKLNYYLYKKEDFIFLKKKFTISYIQNVHDLKYLRYSLILKLK